jgi:hypothetical protein
VLCERLVVAAFLSLLPFVLIAGHNRAESPTRHFDFDAFYLSGQMVLHGEGTGQ